MRPRWWTDCGIHAGSNFCQGRLLTTALFGSHYFQRHSLHVIRAPILLRLFLARWHPVHYFHLNPFVGFDFLLGEWVYLFGSGGLFFFWFVCFLFFFRLCEVGKIAKHHNSQIDTQHPITVWGPAWKCFPPPPFFLCTGPIVSSIAELRKAKASTHNCCGGNTFFFF